MAYIGEQVSIAEYRKLQEVAAQRSDTINCMSKIFDRTRGILNLTFTETNLRSATDLLQAQSNSKELYKFVISHISQSAKSPKAYANMVKIKCEKENIYYKGIDNHPDWFVFQAFKEKAIRKNPTSFSFRFRDALVAFILEQQRGQRKF